MSFVYYIRKGDLIKIGYSARLGVRMRALRPDALLAVEPGTLSLEAQRHRQFAGARAQVREECEWYSISHELLRHVSMLAERYACPDLDALTCKRPPVVLRSEPAKPAPCIDPDFTSMTDAGVVTVAHEALVELRRLQAELPAYAYQMASLRYEHGMTVSAIATEMGFSISKASRLIRATLDPDLAASICS